MTIINPENNQNNDNSNSVNDLEVPQGKFRIITTGVFKKTIVEQTEIALKKLDTEPTPEITRYITDLLLESIRIDDIFATRKGDPIFDINQMVEDVNMKLGYAKRHAFEYLGKRTLMIAGFFGTTEKDEDKETQSRYIKHGAHAFIKAAEIPLADSDTEGTKSEILYQVGSEYPLFSYLMRDLRCSIDALPKLS